MARKSKGNGPSVEKMDDYQAEDDLRTLSRAREISADKDRLGRAQEKAREQVRALQGVAGGGKATPPPPAKRSMPKHTGKREGGLSIERD